MALHISSLQAKHGTEWIKKAWSLFKAQPSTLIGISLFILVFSFLGQLNPVLALVVVFVNPFLTAGFYVLIEQMRQGNRISFDQLGQAIKNLPNKLTLLRLAVVGMVLSTLFTYLTSDWITAMAAGETPSFEQLIIMVVAFFLYLMAFAYAVLVAVFTQETNIFIIIKSSFSACWQNVMPLTVYGIWSMVFALAAIPTMMVAFVIIIPLLTAAFYFSFLDIFGQNFTLPEKSKDEESQSDSDDDNQPPSSDGTFLG